MLRQIEMLGSVVLAVAMVGCTSSAVASSGSAAVAPRPTAAAAQQTPTLPRTQTPATPTTPPATPTRTAAPATPPPTVAPTAPPPAPPTLAPRVGFDPTSYIGKGDAFNCADFASQANAQAVLRADPADPNRLDADRDGIACESNRAPKDLVPVRR